jgi:hypothetical protein
MVLMGQLSNNARGSFLQTHVYIIVGSLEGQVSLRKWIRRYVSLEGGICEGLVDVGWGSRI